MNALKAPYTGQAEKEQVEPEMAKNEESDFRKQVGEIFNESIRSNITPDLNQVKADVLSLKKNHTILHKDITAGFNNASINHRSLKNELDALKITAKVDFETLSKKLDFIIDRLPKSPGE